MRDRISRFFRPETTDAPGPEVEATRPCPHCGKPVSLGATVCIHCERDIVPLLTYAEFARRFGSPHAGGPPHGRPEDLPGSPRD